MMEASERMLSPDYLDGLVDRPIEEVRRMRSECLDVETGLSYLRRMVQGPLDIVSHELTRRANGEGSGDLSRVVADLPDTLGEVPRPAGAGRLSQSLEPTRIDPELSAELDALVGDARMADVTTMNDSELTALAGELRAYEEKVSNKRRSFFDIIDALQGEIARRYRDGEASVDSLLED